MIAGMRFLLWLLLVLTLAFGAGAGRAAVVRPEVVHGPEAGRVVEQDNATSLLLGSGAQQIAAVDLARERPDGAAVLPARIATGAGGPRGPPVTAGHPVWSVTRGRWVVAGELTAGERLAARDGQRAVVLASTPKPDAATWNLEVETEHVYRVGHAGLLVHNACPTPAEVFEGGGAAEGGGQEIVRRFLSKADAKTAKKQGIAYDPNKGAGISTTTTTKAGHADINVQADISLDDIIGSPQRVPKSRQSRVDNE